MEAAFIPGNEARSQPILPSQRSPYFHTFHTDRAVLQDQSWLPPPPPPPHLPPSISLQPHLSRPPLAMASPGSSMSPLGPVPGPYQVHQQSHPYFTQGPSARGYIPQRPRRYFGHQILQEPIIPLRKEFGSLQELEPTRPYSVPSHFTQPPQTISEHNALILPPRPISVAHTSSQHPNGGLISEKGEPLRPLSPVWDTLNDSDSGIPPRRLLPFPTNRRTGAREATSEKCSEIGKKKSPSPKVASADARNESQQVQQTVKKATSSRKTTERKKAQAAQPQIASKPVSPKRKQPSKQSDSNSTRNIEVSKRSTKIGLLGGLADRRTNVSSTEGANAPPSEVNENVSEESHPGPKSQETEVQAAQPKAPSKPGNSKRKSTSKRPDSNSTHNTETPKRPIKIRLVSRLSDRYKTSCSSEGQKPSPSMADENPPQDPHPTQDVLPEKKSSSGSPHLDADAIGISEQTLNDATTARDKSCSVNSDTAKTHTATQRSMSQATTVSTISTNSSVTTARLPASNDEPGSGPMFDETMILEQDMSSIIKTRLQEGKADMIETMFGEMLIKMAVKDEHIFKGVADMLESSKANVFAV